MALKPTRQKFQFGGQLGGKTLLAVLLVVSLALTVLYARESEGGFLHSLQNTTSAVASPLSTIGTAASNLAASASTSVEDLTASDATLSQTRENNKTLAQMAVELEEYRQEAQRLESLLGLSDAYGFNAVAGRITSYSTDSYNRTVTLNVGSSSGVAAGMPVMGSTGVIGQVIGVTAVSSTVRLLTDPQSGISCLLQSCRQEGILYGSVEGTLYLKGVDENANVQVGEAVITSGLGGGYYRGLVIGTVSRVEKKQGDATRTIVVTPNADFTNLNEALVVLSMGSTDATTDANMVNAVSPSTLATTSSNSTGSQS